MLLTLAFAGCVSNGGDPGPQELEMQISWTPQTPLTGQDVTFSVQATSPVSGDRLESVVWKIGERIVETQRPVHVFEAAGTYDVVVQVRSTATGLNQAESTISVLQSAEQIQRDAEPTGQPSQPEPEAPAPTTATGAPLAIVLQQEANVIAFSYAWDQEPELVAWSFGDGERSNDHTPTHTYARAGTYTVTLRATGDEGIEEVSIDVAIPEIETGFVPHVIVAVPDSGINPYHELYRRPDLMSHPCTYIEDFPCDIPALELTLDAQDYQTAFQADKAKWEAIRPGDWYWIPGTSFVAVHCDDYYDPDNGDICILDDSHMHGTGTTSSVIMENPDALIAFKEYDPDISTFMSKKIPVDVYSVSWGPSAPVVGLVGWTPAFVLGLCPWDVPEDIVYVKSSGNEPGLTVLADCWSGHPDAISVGGGFADDTQEPLAYKDMDVVSYYCRPTAQTRSIETMRSSYCGTSFSAPTVAGALSKVILNLRLESGYTGSVVDGIIDPLLDVSVADLRDAMEITATYDPTPQYPNGGIVPVNPVAPYTQWGWGFYDATVTDATTAHLLGDLQPDKSPDARAYLEAQYQLRETLYG